MSIKWNYVNYTDCQGREKLKYNFEVIVEKIKLNILINNEVDDWSENIWDEKWLILWW